MILAHDEGASAFARTGEPACLVAVLGSLQLFTCRSVLRCAPSFWIDWVVAILLRHVALDEQPRLLLAMWFVP